VEVSFFRDQVVGHVRKVVASHQIISSIRKVEEYLRKWGNMLGDVHRFVMAKRLRERQEAELRNDELRKERERKEAEERRKRRRELEEIYDVQDWVTKTCSPPGLAADPTLDYFARCIYYEILIPAGSVEGSPLAPSVNEHLEGYPWHKTSASSYRTVAIPAYPLERTLRGGLVSAQRTKYTATELCKAVNRVLAEDLACYFSANTMRHTHHDDHVWDESAATLFEFVPDGIESDGFLLKITWPGQRLGYEGLVAQDTDTSVCVEASIRILAAEHAFYGMAAHQKDDLYAPPANMVMFMGFFEGNKPYYSPIMGNQNSMVMGGTNPWTDVPVASGPVSEAILEHHEDIDADWNQEEAAASSMPSEQKVLMSVSRADRIWQKCGKRKRAVTPGERARQKELAEFLAFYCGGFHNQRTEVLALTILQARMRGKLSRFEWTTQRAKEKKMAGHTLGKVIPTRFLHRRERRERSVEYAATASEQNLNATSTLRIDDIRKITKFASGGTFDGFKD